MEYKNGMSPFYTSENSLENQEMKRGNYRPSIVRTMQSDTIVGIVDSKQRLGGTDYDFTASFQTPINRPLTVQITQASIPKIPNINLKNNEIIVIHLYGTFKFYLTPGYYNQNSLVTALTDAFNTSFNGADTFTADFNTLNKTISIQSNSNFKWFFSNECSFIRYGSSVANFKAYDPNLSYITYGSVTQYSGPAGLVYTRYVAIRSNTLTKYAVDVPRSTMGILNNVAVISMVGAYDAGDFSVNNVYQGNIILDSAPYISCVLNAAQSGNGMTIVDFNLVDEYGFNIYESLNLGAPYTGPQLGCLIWLNITV